MRKRERAAFRRAEVALLEAAADNAVASSNFADDPYGSAQAIRHANAARQLAEAWQTLHISVNEYDQ